MRRKKPRPQSKTVQPTPLELEILQVLWQRGAGTVRQVHAALGGDAKRGYTTVLKTMQIMHEKGLLLRDGSARAHLYAARDRADTTKRALVTDLLERAFAGSTSSLIQFALQSKPVDDEELEQLRRMLDRAEGERS